MGPRDFIDSGNHNETESGFQSAYFLLSQQPWNSLWFSELGFIAEAVLHIPSVNFFYLLKLTGNFMRNILLNPWIIVGGEL